MKNYTTTVKTTQDLVRVAEEIKGLDFDCHWRSQTPINGSSVLCLGLRTIGGTPMQVGTLIVEDEKIFPACTNLAATIAFGRTSAPAEDLNHV